MAENDWLPRAPVLVEDLRAVGGGNRGHALSPLRLVSGAVGLGCPDKLAPPGTFVPTSASRPANGQRRARTGASFVDELRQPVVRTPGHRTLARTRSTGPADRS